MTSFFHRARVTGRSIAAGIFVSSAFRLRRHLDSIQKVSNRLIYLHGRSSSLAKEMIRDLENAPNEQ
jgi:hypothetical protein